MHGVFIARAARNMGDARATSLTAEQAARAARDAQTKSNALASDVEKLYMITEALWTILKEQHGYTDDELIHRIEEIDLRDGKLDGKVAKQPSPACPKCRRTLMRNQSVCLYCGTAVSREPFER